MAATQDPGTQAESLDKKGRCQTFAPADKEYGLEILKVDDSVKILLDISRVLGGSTPGDLVGDQPEAAAATLEHIPEPSERT